MQAYNAQLAVDDAAQVVVAHGVTNQPADCRNLEPVIERAKENVGEAPANATADAGYWNPEVEARTPWGAEAWVVTGRSRRMRARPCRTKRRPGNGCGLAWRARTDGGCTRAARPWSSW